MRLLGYVDGQAMHIVVAQDLESRICFIVTAY
jgi:hypothetical protein